MIIGHSRPLGITWSVSGAGAGILTPTANLTDGRPDTVSRLQWISGTQTTSSTMRLRADWGTALTPRMVGVLNCSLPEGTPIRARFRKVGDVLGTYAYNPAAYNGSQTLVRGPHGEKALWYMLMPGADPVLGVEIQFVNNVHGAASILPSTAFQIGEAVICEADDVKVASEPLIDPIDPTTAQYSWSRQPYSVPGTPYRELQFSLATDVESEWFGTYAPLLAKIDRGQVCPYVLRYLDMAGNFDTDLLHSYAMLGVATRQPSMRHLARDVFASGQITVVESPIPV